MSTYREVTYLVLDQIKSVSDDSYFEEEHVKFMIDKYRAFLLKQRYSDIKKQIPESNYQNICLDLVEVPAISGEICEGGSYLRSTVKIPTTMNIGVTRVYPTDYYQGEITYINRDRMKYVGHNKYLKNIIYASLGPDTYLYFKSANPQFLHLEKVRMSSVFSNAVEAFTLQCTGDTTCDILDAQVPIEDALIPPLVELCVKDLLGASFRPVDNENNGKDDISNLANYIALNVKSQLAKQIEGQ